MDGAPSEGCSTTTILAQLSIEPDAGAGAVHTITLATNEPRHALDWVMQAISYARHRFPADILRHAVWLYLRFTLSYRDVEDLLAERGLMVSNTDELTVLVDDVKITFLKYPFPTFDPFVIYEQVPLLSVREIAATKAYTIGRRGAYKDYIDLYFTLSEQHATLTDIIDIAEKKFGFEFNSRLFLEQLVFLDDVEDTDIQFLKTAVTRSELLNFFEANIRANAERL